MHLIEPGAEAWETGEVAIFVGPRFVVSVRNHSNEGFLGVRERCEREPQLLRLGPGFVFYALMDAVVDRYFPLLDSLEDELEAIEAKMVTKAIERAQNTVEQRNAEIRKNVLKYDEVMNEQRKIIYQRRDQILSGSDLKVAAMEYLADAVDSLIETHCVSEADDEWDVSGLVTELRSFWPHGLSVEQLSACASTDDMYDAVMADASAYYAQREAELGADTMREIERQVMLRIIDQRWREHLEEMDYLQEGINLRAMGQKDPLTEWQREGFEMFGALMKGVAQDFVKYVMHVQVVRNDAAVGQVQTVQNAQTSGPEDAKPTSGAEGVPAKQGTVVNSASDWSKTPRNAPCPCGSGKKYKQCHGKVA
jgi:preprotein translocase subunit SecA